jgi:7-cyano-7-deazaguanine reductase
MLAFSSGYRRTLSTEGGATRTFHSGNPRRDSLTTPTERKFESLKPKPLETRKELETFPTPKSVSYVKMVSDEVTSLCPITNQPDFETITIEYSPRELCVESKSLKLFFQSLRDEGAFIEDLSSMIAHLVAVAIDPAWVRVTAHQKPRGGIAIDAVTHLGRVIKDNDEVGYDAWDYTPNFDFREPWRD